MFTLPVAFFPLNYLPPHGVCVCVCVRFREDVTAGLHHPAGDGRRVGQGLLQQFRMHRGHRQTLHELRDAGTSMSKIYIMGCTIRDDIILCVISCFDSLIHV